MGKREKKREIRYTDKEIREISQEAAKIYYDYDVSSKEAIKRAEAIVLSREVKVEKYG